jgi:uncharacterized protein (DUF305 family)
MTDGRLSLALAVVAATMAFGAYAQTGHQGGHAEMQGAMQAMMPNSKDSPATQGYKSAHMNMMVNSPKEFTGDADLDFARQMIAHHRGGIEMAKVELQHGKDPKMRAAAQKIVDDQQKDIADLQAWIKAHGK